MSEITAEERNRYANEIESRGRLRLTAAEWDLYWNGIYTNGTELAAKYQLPENRKKLPAVRAEVRRKLDTVHGLTKKKSYEKSKKRRQRAPIEHGDLEKLAAKLRPGDEIIYRAGKAWSKPLKGIVIKVYPHIVWIEGGVKAKTVMLFDILKCELKLFDDGWRYEKDDGRE